MFQNLYAANGAAQQSGGSLSMLVFIGIFFVIFYLVTVRPKQKQQQQHKNLVDGLDKGDEVITYSGIMGKIVRVKGNYTVINLVDDIEIKIQKNHISNILPKGTLKSI